MFPEASVEIEILAYAPTVFSVMTRPVPSVTLKDLIVLEMSVYGKLTNADPANVVTNESDRAYGPPVQYVPLQLVNGLPV
jgi:hypothetical protein